MSYDMGSIEQGIAFFNEVSQDISNGRSDSDRSKLQQAKQIFEQCKDTHAEAKDWLAKTNQKLSKAELNNIPD
jgi:hypothetical protein